MNIRAAILLASLSGASLAAPSPRVTMKEARRLALSQVPGGKVQSAELETENGKRVYSFDIKGQQPGVEEIQIDADTGAVVSKVHEDPAAEAAEKKADEQKQH